MSPDATGRVPTRTRDTIRSYRHQAALLIAQAQAETGLPAGRTPVLRALHWFVGQHRRWVPATLRVYRASLHQAIDDARTANAMTPGEADAALALLSGDLPAARTSGPRRTSARKRKAVTAAEEAALVADLASSGRADDDLLARWVAVNAAVGLRPCEWQGAVCTPEALVLDGAKCTNGRGLAQRQIDLSHEPRATILAIAELVRDLLRRAIEIGSWRALQSRMASRLARACRRSGVRRVALYTTRHVALADAKQYDPPGAVAARAGHVSDRTAGTHYARRGSGRGVRPIGTPSPADVARVKISGRAFRNEHLAADRSPSSGPG